MYGVYEIGTNKLIKTYKTVSMARKSRDKLDNAYGCYHYYYKAV